MIVRTQTYGLLQFSACLGWISSQVTCIVWDIAAQFLKTVPIENNRKPFFQWMTNDGCAFAQAAMNKCWQNRQNVEDLVYLSGGIVLSASGLRSSQTPTSRNK